MERKWFNTNAGQIVQTKYNQKNKKYSSELSDFYKVFNSKPNKMPQNLVNNKLDYRVLHKKSY